ncbi:NAD-dependent epimerase/dehydratase family protein [Hyphobacterium sp.]|uniref:NAD-dependent epimerase/dehydratase family protein n=1 Tax=Hyphobacterium sp. TaxID=2004662 RepID=UPI003BAD6AF0
MGEKLRVIVTGAAGFIGHHAVKALLNAGHDVLGLDNLNDYYDLKLKTDRLEQIGSPAGFAFEKADIADPAKVETIFGRYAPTHVLHLAAQAGVRYSIDHPFSYIDSNIRGHLSVLEAARRSSSLRHVVYASSSSVYGNDAAIPFSEADPADKPVSLYAATKRADELLSESYARLYNIPQTGLRFFTVYGPWGRPDMAYWLFTKAILDSQPIKVFNNGELERDFTYIDDVIDVVVKIVEEKDTAFGHRLYNIGGSRPVPIKRFINVIASACGRQAECVYRPMQKGDVYRTHADLTRISRDYGYEPTTDIETGIPRFVEWYRDYFGK